VTRLIKDKLASDVLNYRLRPIYIANESRIVRATLLSLKLVSGSSVN
jgi:hypothetical protein